MIQFCSVFQRNDVQNKLYWRGSAEEILQSHKHLWWCVIMIPLDSVRPRGGGMLLLTAW